MARDVSLTTIKGGLNRLRTKGAALEDSLYDLLNGYVTTEKTVKVRPGTFRENLLPSGTKGLVAFGDSKHVFASSEVSGLPANYTLHILRSPTNAPLTKIHFAEPFLGFLYVAAEFSGGDVYHFWLADADEWEADTEYDANDYVTSTTSTALRFRATRKDPAFPTWTPNAPRALGDKVEPTDHNGYYFEVVEVVGDSPRSGNEEPDWDDVVAGEQIMESVDGTDMQTPATPPVLPGDQIPRRTEDRYVNRRRRVQR